MMKKTILDRTVVVDDMDRHDGELTGGDGLRFTQ